MAVIDEPDGTVQIMDEINAIADHFQDENPAWFISESARESLAHLILDGASDGWLLTAFPDLTDMFLPAGQDEDGKPLPNVVSELLIFIRDEIERGYRTSLPGGRAMREDMERALNGRIGAIQIAQYLTPFVIMKFDCSCWPRGA